MSLDRVNTRMLTGAEFDRWENTYTTVNTGSANWIYQGTDIKALTGNWENTYTTVRTSSATWGSGSGGSGLTNIVETFLTASPNNTVNAVRLSATGGTTNVDIVISPKGTGAIIFGRAPDGADTGGNKRGTRAVDLAMERLYSTDVASGDYSFNCGRWNRASGLYSFCSGIQNTSTSSAAAALGGTGNNASGPYSFVTGTYNNTSGQSAAAFGDRNTSSGANSMSFGNFCQATAENSFAAGTSSTSSARSGVALGENSVANRTGIVVTSCGGSAVGESQNLLATFTGLTTGADLTECFIRSTTRLTIPATRVMHGIAIITGSKTDGSSVARFMRQFTIKNVAGTTSLVGSIITIGTDEAPSTTAVEIAADDTNDALRIRTAGVASENWRWGVSIYASEFKYA